MKTTKSYAELLELVRNINSTTAEKKTKREEKLKKIAAKVKPIFDQYNEQREDIRLDNAYTDDKGVLLLNERGDYRYTKDGAKAMTKQMKELLDKTFEFYQFTFSTEGIEDLYFLSGWVEGIEPDKEQDDEQVQ